MWMFELLFAEFPICSRSQFINLTEGKHGNVKTLGHVEN